MSKIFNDISDDHIDDKELARLKLHILAAGYLEESLSCFTEVLTKNDNENKDEVVEEPEVSDSGEEKKQRKVQR